jgi:hypothetical protein
MQSMKSPARHSSRDRLARQAGLEQLSSRHDSVLFRRDFR